MRRAESRHLSLMTSCVRLVILWLLIFHLTNVFSEESYYSSPRQLRCYLFVSFLVLFLSLPLTFLLSPAADIIDPYVPPEGDARLTSLSKDGLKQKVEKLRQTAASQLAYVPPF